jgi:DNA-binding NarL/FixJ family response regulator
MTDPLGGEAAAPHSAIARPIRVLVADDQPLMRSGFRLILEGQPGIVVVGEARDGEEAVTEAHRLRPDVVLMDVRMPNLDGIAATRQILGSVASEARVLVLTMFDLDEYVYGALQAGASGFLLKDVSPEQLVMAIHVVAAGDQLLAPSVTRRLIERYLASVRPPLAATAAAMDRLTPREREILDFVAGGLGNGEIARELVLAESTVKTHVANVLAKLDLHDRVQLVIFAYEQGLVPARRER